jgi:NAD(P)-dependent dehydrogenase (short-subunit alcohol dehydrogenase family)
MTDRIALITGASRGLGAALAEALAPDFHVIAVARTTGALEELDDRIQARGGNATLAPMDVTEAAAMQHLCRSIHERWGKLDLWVHTAIHVPPLTPADHLDEKDWQKVVDTGITATGRLIPYVSPLLQAAEGGVAVHVDDPAEGKFLGAYAAAKAAQRALYRAWAAETEKTQSPRLISFTPNPMPTATRARFYPGEDRSKLSHPSVEAARLIAALP